jgi:hypothetical protein
MLQLTVTIEPEQWDERSGEFIPPKEKTIQLEHSLVSLSKWESKWCKPFLHSDKTGEEVLDYIKCMTLTQNVPPELYTKLSSKNIETINEYINAPMTATTFSDNGNSKKNREIVTSELVYYWMVAYNIPFECQKWHLNRLITLIRVCGVKNEPPKKMSKNEIMKRNAELNAKRRAKLNSKG